LRAGVFSIMILLVRALRALAVEAMELAGNFAC
jgi:hypothetical protein